MPNISKPNAMDFAVPMIKVTPATSTASTITTNSILSMTAASPSSLKTTTISVHPSVSTPFETKSQFEMLDPY